MESDKGEDPRRRLTQKKIAVWDDGATDERDPDDEPLTKEKTNLKTRTKVSRKFESYEETDSSDRVEVDAGQAVDAISHVKATIIFQEKLSSIVDSKEPCSGEEAAAAPKFKQRQGIISTKDIISTNGQPITFTNGKGMMQAGDTTVKT